jgi:ferredoxin
MIVAQRKKIPELVDILKGHKKILLLGCGTCVTVCLAGGEREVSINASALRIASRLKNLAFEVEELTIERQCDQEKRCRSFTGMRRRGPGDRRAVRQAGLRGTRHGLHWHPRRAGHLDGKMHRLRQMRST